MPGRHSNRHDELIVTSALNRLLAERGVTQKELSELAGVSERAVSRIKNRKLWRIDCRTAARICSALSRLPNAETGRVAPVRLDVLFPMFPRGTL